MYPSKRITKFVRHIIPLVVFAFLAAGCSDSPTEPDDDGDHIEAAGFAIESEGVEMLRYLDADGGTPVLPDLQAGTTYEMAVVFLDENGNPLPHEEHEGEEEEEEHGLRVTIANPSIAVWHEEHEHEGEEHEHHEHVEFHGELEALAAGSTGMQLCILHEDHCDYESPTITVTVVE